MHLRSHPQLQVVEPPDLIYFRFVIIISFYYYFFFFVLVCCLGCYLCFCFVLGTFLFNQPFFEDVTSVDCIIFLRRQFAILNSML